jgi:hypothetical protein
VYTDRRTKIKIVRESVHDEAAAYIIVANVWFALSN